MKAILHWTLIAIIAFVVLFIMQNMARTDVSLLFWVLRPHLSVVILASFACGAVAGWIARILLRRRHKRASQREQGISKA